MSRTTWNMVLAALLAATLVGDYATAQGRGGGGNRGGGGGGGGNRGGGNPGGGGGGGRPQFAPQQFSQPARQPAAQVAPRIQAGPANVQGNLGINGGGRGVGAGVQAAEAARAAGINLGGNAGTRAGVTAQKPIIPDLRNVVPNTTLRNQFDANANARVGNQAQQARIAAANQAQLNRNSPQHPQHWDNWGQTWRQGNIPAYQRNLYGGTWNGFYGPSWYSGYRGGYGYGNGLGGGNFGYGYGGYGYGYGGLGLGRFGGLAGLTPFLLNSSGYRWGYQNYNNPYYGSGGGYPYNYAQPIYVTYANETDPSDSEQLEQAFAHARTSFRAGDYERALGWTDHVIRANPSDTVAHEFRALTLFAMGRYDESAATLNALLAVAPGWNWATMVGFYPNVETYTQQIRALESYSKSHSDEAAPLFTLAYHYLVTGHPAVAQAKLEEVVRLAPRDQVARQLLQGLNHDDAQEAPGPPREKPAPPAADTATELEGAWTAKREGGETFQMTLTKAGDFTWNAGIGENTRKIAGRYDVDGNVILLDGGKGNTLAATVTAEKDDQFNFKLLGAPPEDPGLTFTRSGK